jgi:hypothetical protein
MQMRKPEVSFIHIGEDFELTSPFPGEEFSLLLWSDVEASVDQQIRLSQQIVAQRCRNVACGGHDCERWHDIIDECSYELPLVMTTWHDGETINEVAKYFSRFGDFSEGYRGTKFAVAYVGHDPERRTKVFRAVERLVKRRLLSG